MCCFDVTIPPELEELDEVDDVDELDVLLEELLEPIEPSSMRRQSLSDSQPR